MKPKLAYLHNNIFVPGLGDIRKDLVPGSPGIARVDSLEIEGSYLIVKAFSTTNRRNFTVYVPITNVSHVIMSDEVVTTPHLKE